LAINAACSALAFPMTNSATVIPANVAMMTTAMRLAATGLRSHQRADFSIGAMNLVFITTRRFVNKYWDSDLDRRSK
jgi:hypothetical protein